MYSHLVTFLLATAIVPNVALAGSFGDVLRQRPSIRSKQHRRALKIKRQNDAQSSLNLDPSQLMPNQQLTGQETPAAGQVDSLTSTNGFINYCLTQTDVPLTNGKQNAAGSCNQTPIGQIIATDKIPSAVFTSPPNGGTIKSNTDFKIDMVFTNIATGNKVNTQNSWGAAPQQLDSNGVVLGYSNFIIEEISALNSSEALDASKFTFFKAVSTKANNGVLSTTVKGGLKAGVYKVSSNNVDANGMPVLVAVAQHGTMDACNYFFVTDDGKAVDIPALSDKATASASVTATASDATATATNSTATATDSAATDSAATETATNSAATATETAAESAATETGASATASGVETSAAAAATSTSASTQRGRGGGRNRTSKEGNASSTAAAAASTSAAADATSEAAADATSTEAASSTAEETASEVTSAAEETQTTGGGRGGGRDGGRN